YLFHLPFYILLQSSLTLLTVLTLAIVLAIYVFFGLQRASGSGRIAIGANATSHLSVLLFILVASWGWSFYLDHYELVYSTLGVVYGAGYAADHGAVGGSPHLSEIRCAAERAGARDALPEKLHRLHAKGLPAGCNPGNVLSSPGGSDARCDREEPGHDPEHSSLGRGAAAS